MTGRDQAVFDTKLFAEPVEHMRTAGFLLFAASGEAVGELATVVGQQLDNLDRAGLRELGEEIGTAAVDLVGIELDEDPTRGAVDST